jgi:hypothetical protein
MVMTHRRRKQLIAALVLAPLVIAMPVLWPELGEPDFIRSNLDILLIFIAAPLAAALWLAFGFARQP